ncbi:MAG: DUF4982 domain-containing protein [Clostridium sp.]|nr:DUF4982 domain-containing protein [Clostridium sp.]
MSKVRLFNDQWSFRKTLEEVPAEVILSEKREFVPVDLPHDWLIYQVKDLYESGYGWYYKRFVCDVDTSKGETAILRFDGVYMDCEVYLNGGKAGEWKYGYSTFEVDLSACLRRGENEVLVKIRHRSPNSRWYSGAGIYRDVWLKECRPAYLPEDGVYVNIRKDGEAFWLEAETEVAGGEAEGEKIAGGVPLFCAYSLWQEGELAAELGRKPVVAWNAPAACSGAGNASGLGNAPEAAAGSSAAGAASGLGNAPEAAAGSPVAGNASVIGKAFVRAKIEAPKLWDTENPACYELRVGLYRSEENEDAADGGQADLWDERRLTVGFRTVAFDPEQGLLLNGKRLKVHGVCEHHDLGCLGAAFSRGAMERKFRILREMGVNGIRTSHNMPAPELMELADRMGFLVVDEAFDMWERRKTEYDYARFFKEWSARDVASWIRRDRNHPSLLLWSIGNEIYDTHADAHGQEITSRLMALVRLHDPKGNAGLTLASNYMPWENARKCADLVKIAGYNYAERYYEAHHAAHPDWVIYGSETSSVVQSRGVYHFPLAQPSLSEEDEQCSALGNSSTSWGAKSIESCIIDDRDTDFAFGQFIWTGFDYIGEPTPYHTKNSYFGQLDTAGFPKDSYYIFQSQWTDAAKAPMVHVFPYWDFNEGQLIDVRACTNGAAVELFVNGESWGRQEKTARKLLGEWQVPYRKGSIRAVAYDEGGAVIAEKSRSSFGDGVRLALTPQCREHLAANGEDLSFLTVEAEDAEGRLVENASSYVRVKVEGEGRLLGLDNGDSTDYDEYKGTCRKLFQGKLLAVVATTLRAGEIKVTVTGEGLEGAQVSLFSEPARSRPGISVTEALQAGKPCARWNESRAAESEPAEDGSRPERSGGGRIPDGQPDPGRNGAAEGEPRTGSRIPVRKVELRILRGTNRLTPERNEASVEARIFPENADDRELIWKAVNAAGVEVHFAKVEEISKNLAKVTAFGDGEFWIRCMSKSGTSKVRLISQLEFQAQGLGQAFLDPYDWISASLYTETIGEVGSGNDKGIATARDGTSGVVYSQIQFGDYGSDEITVPVFALSEEEYPIEIWQGKPGEADSRLLLRAIYRKPPIWNVYQEETWKLPCRLKGVATVAFLLHAKVHIKGFRFRQYEKAVSRLPAAECSRVYGDQFTVGEEAVTGIGNNVTLEYANMDFGTEGVSRLTIWGSTPLRANTIHVYFTGENQERVNRMVEFQGKEACGEEKQVFSLERISGKGKVEFVFLPGSDFDFHSFLFERG